MSYHNMQCIHKPLVQVKIGSISVSLYPMLNASMLAAERAHGFHVDKNNLLAANLTPRQVLNALGQQTGQGTVVGGKIAGFSCHFKYHWHNFQNLTILSWHNSAGTLMTYDHYYYGGQCISPISDSKRFISRVTAARCEVRPSSSVLRLLL